MFLKKLSSSYTEYNKIYASQYILGNFQKGTAKILAHTLQTTLTGEFPYFTIQNINFHSQKENFKPFVGLLDPLDEVIKRILNLEFSFSLEFYKNMGLYNNQTTHFTKKDIQSLTLLKNICTGKLHGAGVLYAKDLILPAGMKCLNPDQVIAYVPVQGFIGFTFELGLFFGDKKKHPVGVNYASYAIKAHPILHIDLEIIKSPSHLSEEYILLYIVTKGTLNPDEALKITSYMLLNQNLNVMNLFRNITN